MVIILSKEVLDNVLRRLMLAFQYKPSTEQEYKATFELYYNSFKEASLTEKQLLDVSGRLVMTWKPEFGRKFPTVKEFIDIAGVSAQSIAVKAHSRIRKDIMLISGYKDYNIGLEHRHFVAMECIRQMGGWFKVAQNGIYEWDKSKDRFFSLFEEIYYSTEVPKKPLLGHTDIRDQDIIELYNTNQITN